MYLRPSVAIALAAILLAGCAHKKHVRRTPPPPAPAPSAAPKPGYTETGVASWYGHPYHGRPAANGEIYDMEKLTAAHRTLPFDTWLRVVNLGNGKTVEVRINDRGPFVEGRIIDLSHAAARAIDMIGSGIARVRIEVIRTPEYVPPGVFGVQVGAFRNRANAERLCAEMQSRYGSGRLVQRADSPDLWRVLVGSEATEEGANSLAARIRRELGEKSAAFVVRVDSM
jgi:rare lipoprotein A